MANWTPNNSEAANSSSLQIWFDANNTAGYVTESSTTTDDDYGAANNISRINNLGTTGYYLERQGSGYPTLRTGSLPGKNGFKFGNKSGGWSSTPMQSNNAAINTIEGNANRIIFSVVSNVFVDARGATFKGIWGYGDFTLREGFSVFVDNNGDRDSPILSFTFSDHAPTASNLIADPSPGNKFIITAQNSSSNNQSLFLDTQQIVTATETLATDISSADVGFKLGSSNYTPDSSDYVLHELLVYSVADSGSGADGFRNTVEGYLAHKWGITDLLPSDHPYKSAAPQIGGGGGGSYPNTQSPPTGVKISADFTDNQMSQLVTQYDRGANQEAYVPFRLSVRGPSNLRLRPSNKVYKITKD